MAKEATTTRKAPAKAAAAKAPDADKTAADTAAASEDKAPAAKSTAKKSTATKTSESTSGAQAKTATVTFDKDHHGGNVRGAVNGQRFEFPVGKPVPVTEAQLSVLNDSGARFTVNKPLAGVDADEGSSASTTVLAGTATRLGGGAAVDPSKPAPELRQITDNELTVQRQDQQDSQDNAVTNPGADHTGGGMGEGTGEAEKFTSPRDGDKGDTASPTTGE